MQLSSRRPETKDIGVHTFEQDGKRIHLIDTPGFDDTYKSDADVLKDLAYYLTKSYDRGIKLTGIIYLHPITHNRMTGTAFKNLRTFRKLCGTESMSAVVLVTTMWELVTPRSEGVKREQELRDEPDFWGTMQREGSTIVQHANTRESALAILATLVGRGRGTTVLDIQHEMVDLGRSLDDTEAGREVDREMRAQREVFERRLEDTKRELQEAVETSNQQHADEIMREQREFEDKLVAIQRGRDELRISMEKLIEERDKQHMEEMAKVQQQLDQSKDELKKQAEEYEKVKQFQVAQKEQYEAEKKEQEEIHEQIRLQAAESEFISRILLISSQMKEEDGKRKEHEHKVKEELYLQMMKSYGAPQKSLAMHKLTPREETTMPPRLKSPRRRRTGSTTTAVALQMAATRRSLTCHNTPSSRWDSSTCRNMLSRWGSSSIRAATMKGSDWVWVPPLAL